jgi:hypothetical protein
MAVVAPRRVRAIRWTGTGGRAYGRRCPRAALVSGIWCARGMEAVLLVLLERGRQC